VIIRSHVVSVESVASDGDVVEMIGVVAPPLRTLRRVLTLRPISRNVVLHPLLLGCRSEGRAWNLVFGMRGIFLVGRRAIVVLDDALYAVSPRTGNAQLETKDLQYLGPGVVVEQLVSDGPNYPMALTAPS